ncbi:hypothetical protein ABFX02_05G085300 [Erythranthe guttata]
MFISFTSFGNFLLLCCTQSCTQADHSRFGHMKTNLTRPSFVYSYEHLVNDAGVENRHYEIHVPLGFDVVPYAGKIYLGF